MKRAEKSKKLKDAWKKWELFDTDVLIDF